MCPSLSSYNIFPVDEHYVDIELWHSEWAKKHPKKDPDSAGETVKYFMPRGFPPIHQLPPSLCPPLLEKEKTDKISEWGL